jgi:hypothetical protein
MPGGDGSVRLFLQQGKKLGFSWEFLHVGDGLGARRCTLWPSGSHSLLLH